MSSDLRKLGKESLIYGLSTVVARLLNFILMPFYTHYLIPGEYGIVATVFSYIAFFNIIYAYGLNQGYMRHFGEEKSLSTSFNCVFYTSFLFSLILALFSAPLASVSGIGGENSKLVVYAALILCLDSLTLIPFADLRMKHKAYAFAGIRTLGICVNVALNVVFLKYADYGIKGIFLANIISSAVPVIMFAGYFKNLFTAPDKETLKRMLGYSLPFLPAGLSSIAIQVIDRPIMLKLTSPYWVGIYQANYRLAIFMSLLVTMFDQAWRPFVIERANDPKAPPLFAGVFRYFSFFTAFAWLFLAFFISDIAKIEIAGVYLIHPDYWLGLSLIPIVMDAYFFDGLYINFIAPVIIKKNTWLIMTATIAGAALNIAFNFLLVPKFNIIGAAWSAFISYFSMCFIMYFAARKIYPIPYEFGKLALLMGSALAPFAVWRFYGEKVASCQEPAFKVALFICFPLLVWVSGFFTRDELASFQSFLREKMTRK